MGFFQNLFGSGYKPKNELDNLLKALESVTTQVDFIETNERAGANHRVASLMAEILATTSQLLPFREQVEPEKFNAYAMEVLLFSFYSCVDHLASKEHSSSDEEDLAEALFRLFSVLSLATGYSIENMRSRIDTYIDAAKNKQETEVAASRYILPAFFSGREIPSQGALGPEAKASEKTIKNMTEKLHLINSMEKSVIEVEFK